LTYTPETLADRWQCSARHVRNLISRGKAFARPQGLNSGVFVITPNRGLLTPSGRMTLEDRPAHDQFKLEGSISVVGETLGHLGLSSRNQRGLVMNA
jgi:hypothetical protein